MKKIAYISSAFLVVFSVMKTPLAFAHAEGPCHKIKEQCQAAGFIQGDAKEGKGLWVDCVDPIIQGTTAKKSVLPLPTVDASTIAACKKARPKFGAGKVAN
jgi:hypothetical protein